MTEPHAIPSYTERLEQMLVESNIRLAAAIDTIQAVTCYQRKTINERLDRHVEKARATLDEQAGRQ